MVYERLMMKNKEANYNYRKYYSVSVFFGIAIPIMIQGLVFQLQNIVDKVFLGNLKTEYLTAIGVTQSPFFMTITVIMAIGTGLSIIVGHQ
jgi:Na+-driven multidrug efflux pump